LCLYMCVTCACSAKNSLT